MTDVEITFSSELRNGWRHWYASYKLHGERLYSFYLFPNYTPPGSDVVFARGWMILGDKRPVEGVVKSVEEAWKKYIAELILSCSCSSSYLARTEATTSGSTRTEPPRTSPRV